MWIFIATAIILNLTFISSLQDGQAYKFVQGPLAKNEEYLGISRCESGSGGQPGQGEVPRGAVHRLRVVRGRPFNSTVAALPPDRLKLNSILYEKSHQALN
jgi:hypothetical protein